MKLAIVGSRNFNDYAKLEAKLRELYDISQITLVISGGAAGADTLAERFACERKLPQRIHRAQWAMHGRSAGPIRNRLIVNDCDALVAFWNGRSAGTRSAIKMARARSGVTVHVIKV